MFYDAFEKMCRDKGVSPAGACTAMGLSTATASQWKKRGSTPSAGVLMKVANYFDVNAEQLSAGNIVFNRDYAGSKKSTVAELAALSGVDEELLNMLTDLNPHDVQFLKGFVFGLKSK